MTMSKKPAVKRKPTQARLTPENQQWLDARKHKEERSSNWIINNVFDLARKIDQQVQGAAQ